MNLTITISKENNKVREILKKIRRAKQNLGESQNSTNENNKKARKLVRA